MYSNQLNYQTVTLTCLSNVGAKVEVKSFPATFFGIKLKEFIAWLKEK
jgi:hypothetical protein